MTLDWSDPELKAIRDDFIRSMGERLKALESALSALKGASADPTAALKEVQSVAHKLAGTAASYGFPSLTRAGELIDDRLEAVLTAGKDLKGEAVRALEYGAVFGDSIRAGMDGRDDASVLDRPALKALVP